MCCKNNSWKKPEDPQKFTICQHLTVDSLLPSFSLFFSHISQQCIHDSLTDVHSLCPPLNSGPQLIWLSCRQLQLNRSPSELLSSSVHFHHIPIYVHRHTILATAQSRNLRVILHFVSLNTYILWLTNPVNSFSKHPLFSLLFIAAPLFKILIIPYPVYSITT